MDNTTVTLEQVIYRLVEGTAEETFLAANASTYAWLAAQPGFIARELAVAPDGTWVDHVWWADLASAEAASGAYMATDACTELGVFLDQASASFRHCRIALTVGRLAGPAGRLMRRSLPSRSPPAPSSAPGCGVGRCYHRWPVAEQASTPEQAEGDHP